MFVVIVKVVIMPIMIWISFIYALFRFDFFLVFERCDRNKLFFCHIIIKVSMTFIAMCIASWCMISAFTDRSVTLQKNERRHCEIEWNVIGMMNTKANWNGMKITNNRNEITNLIELNSRCYGYYCSRCHRSRPIE